MKKNISKSSQKQKNPLLEKIEKTYGKDSGGKSDKEVKAFLDQAGFPSLSKLLFPKMLSYENE